MNRLRRYVVKQRKKCQVSLVRWLLFSCLLLVIVVSGQTPSMAQVVRDHRTSPPNTLDILTYNIQFLPIGDLQQNERAGLIPESEVMNQVDVVVFQEAFLDSARSKVIRHLNERGFVYQTRVVGTDESFLGVPYKEDGGVVILSKWPIEN